MDDLTQEQKDALEKFKSTKDDPETIAGLFYKLLERADPRFKDSMERKAAILMNAGYQIGKELSESEKDSKKKEEMEQKLRTMAQRINASVRENMKKASKSEDNN